MTSPKSTLLDLTATLPPRARILLVDDNASILSSLSLVLEHSGFDVVSASSVKDALKHIAGESFDALLSDLHMPNAGDGLTVVSAMRHSNPNAVTIIFSGYPEMREAAAAIVLQADEILVKPLAVETLVSAIKERLHRGANRGHSVENVAHILERKTASTIEDWLDRIDRAPDIITVPLDRETRSSHLPQLFRDLIFRLRNPLPLGDRAMASPSALKHGLARRQQGYTAAMMVEESRMLQVSIFQTLQDSLHKVDFSLLLVGVMAIADEVDSQLAQALSGYITESHHDTLPLTA